MMGPGPLNPRNLGWMVGDPTEYYTAWELFRQLAAGRLVQV